MPEFSKTNKQNKEIKCKVVAYIGTSPLDCYGWCITALGNPDKTKGCNTPMRMRPRYIKKIGLAIWLHKTEDKS